MTKLKRRMTEMRKKHRTRHYLTCSSCEGQFDSITLTSEGMLCGLCLCWLGRREAREIKEKKRAEKERKYLANINGREKWKNQIKKKTMKQLSKILVQKFRGK